MNIVTEIKPKLEDNNKVKKFLTIKRGEYGFGPKKLPGRTPYSL